MKKRVLALFLSMVLLCSSAFALEPAFATDDSSAVKETVETYLRECTSGIYFHETDADAISNTLMAPALLDNESAVEWAGEEALCDFAEDACFDLARSLGKEVPTMDEMLQDLNTQSARVAFLGHLYESQDITYSSFDVQYLFQNIEATSNLAAVDVLEALNYQYSDCDEPTYEEIRYNITLTKLNGEWVIADVISDDHFFLEHYADADFSLEEAIDGYDTAVAAADLVLDGDAIEADTAAQAASNIAYDRRNAANYALTYSTSTDTGSTPEFKNNLFNWFGADCMNFASQCVWAGFGGSNSAAAIQSGYGMDKVGTNSGNTAWWCNATTGTNSWASCRNFRLYIQNSAASSEKGILASLTPYAYNSDTIGTSAEDLIGSVLHVKGYSSGKPVAGGHAVIVNNATGTKRSEVYYCSYNNCAKNKKLSLGFPASSTDTYQGVAVITPKTFQDGQNGTRLWADLLNVVVDKTVPRTLTGYASETMKTIQMIIRNPNGVPVMDYSWNNVSEVSASFAGFNMSGEWRIELIGTDSAGAQTSFFYTVRVK